MKKKVLIIEDEDVIRKYLVYELKKAGFDTISACSGNEAVKLLRNEKVDAIVTDYRMPDGNGLVVLDFVKALDYKPEFYFISADSSFIDDNCSNELISKVFTKPFQVADILAALKSAG